jgi:hypothetical protein
MPAALNRRVVWALPVVLLTLVATLVLSASFGGSKSASRTTSNPPWYASLEAFEHYNSGRSHVFSMAQRSIVPT